MKFPRFYNENEVISIQSPMSTQAMATTYREFYDYWEKLGWTVIKPAPLLPGFERKATTDYGNRTRINQERMV